MAKYKLIENESGQQYIEWDDNGTIRFIPIEESNSDYQTYLRWLENPDAEENGTIS